MRANVPTTFATLIAPGIDTITAYVAFAGLDFFYEPKRIVSANVSVFARPQKNVASRPSNGCYNQGVLTVLGPGARLVIDDIDGGIDCCHRRDRMLDTDIIALYKFIQL